MIKLLAFFAAYRLLRRVVTIAIVATLAVLLLSGPRDTADRGNHSVSRLQQSARPLEQVLKHTLEKAIGP